MKRVILLLVMCLVLAGCTASTERPFSAIVINAVDLADKAISNSIRSRGNCKWNTAQISENCTAGVY